jgi:hypothetical protein
MLYLRSIIALLLLYFALPTQVCAMENNLEAQISNLEELLEKNLSHASSVATTALLNYCNNDSIAPEIIDVFIEYADPDDLREKLSEFSGATNNYLREQVTKTIEEYDSETDATEDLTELNYSSGDEESKEDRSTTTKNQEIPGKSFFSDQKKMGPPDEKKIGKLTKEIENQLRNVKLNNTKMKKQPTHQKRTPNNRTSSFASVKWVCLCAGLLCGVYYLYSYKKHKPVNH